MAVVDNAMTFGRPRLDFAKQHDIDEFVEVLGKYERGEITPESWRKFRLVRGTYGQRQDNVQMMRIKIPQGIVTAQQMRALADASAKYSRGFGHVTTRQNVQFHFVPLKNAEPMMRDDSYCGTDKKTYTACEWACGDVPSGISVWPEPCRADGSRAPNIAGLKRK